jgi:hypothetical protein
MPTTFRAYCRKAIALFTPEECDVYSKWTTMTPRSGGATHLTSVPIRAARTMIYTPHPQ